jgi:hypothetical protein
MAMLAREANLRKVKLETAGKEKMAYKGKENNSEFDFNINKIETMADVILYSLG